MLSGIVLNQLRADLELVDAKRSALAAIRRRVPDIVLMTSRLSSRDEREIVAQLRATTGAEHVKTLTIPPLRSEEHEKETGGGLLRAFRRKPAAERPPGCDPKVFAKQLTRYLRRADELKRDDRRPAPQPAASAPVVTPRNIEAPETGPLIVPKHAASPRAYAETVPERPAAPVVGARPVALAPLALLSVRPALDTLEGAIDGDLGSLMNALRLPLPVAAFTYPRGCRIRHVRLGSATPPFRLPVAPSARSSSKPRGRHRLSA